MLLEQAEAVLRERGIDALSLRELAREAGVSHGAPRSHFVDRSALLDALAERGFVRLADQIRDAASQVPADQARALHAAASAYLRFAERDPALLDLMFATKADGPSEAVRNAAERLFGVMTDIMNAGVEAGTDNARDVGRLTLLLSATVQGISALVTSQRITTSQGEMLIDDAISVFLTGVSAERGQ
ncbi:TetR/AcrR family transcriptional regulator [Nonomuraea sp. NPDC049784]|uniref:TetR/AcrR family transcriptional regulator n=1 Tax=Nonomuraea sp. NPDC049784 TaxID=3154361 RepID=UPI003400607B